MVKHNKEHTKQTIEAGIVNYVYDRTWDQNIAARRNSDNPNIPMRWDIPGDTGDSLTLQVCLDKRDSNGQPVGDGKDIVGQDSNGNPIREYPFRRHVRIGQVSLNDEERKRVIQLLPQK